jgi:hypothetical protein
MRHTRFGTFACVLFCLIFFVLGACRSRTESAGVLRDGSVEEQFRGNGSYPIWSYDAGPDPQTTMGRELIDLASTVPSFPNLSNAVYGSQMFRPAFGPIPWRMMQKPNSVKILFIGQDGTHIAEAAGRPATAGFGGRAQDLAKYFGVSSSAAFINAFAFTIRWQYGVFDSPIINLRTGRPQISFGSFTANPVWLLSQDLQSPIVKWRNDMIRWIIRNNRDSLKMIVTFGGAARDAAGSFVVAHGGKVGTRLSEADLSSVRIPETEYRGAGGNKQTVVPVDRTGADLYAEFNGRVIDYTKPEAVSDLQKRFREAFNTEPESWMNKMVLPKGGIGGSGLVHPAQLGGYDIARKMEINGQRTISLKGLKIADDLTIGHDILVTQLPHPTALSMMSATAASEAVANGLSAFKPWVEAGWSIDADPGFVNSFAKGEPYRYSRADMGTEYYDFGAPNSRMVNVSTASRNGSNVIIFGTRERVSFDRTRLRSMTEAKPSSAPPAEELWLTRPSQTDGTTNPGPRNRRFTFDAGPREQVAKLMKTSLSRQESFIERFEVNGDFAHYRGTFDSPEVVVIADPDGDDDLVTARALTGSRGQYLHSLIQALGVEERYLVLKVAPFSKYPSDSESWSDIMRQTRQYREVLFAEVFGSARPKLILLDGPDSIAEFDRIITSPSAPVIRIARQGEANASGIAEAVAELRQLPGFEGIRWQGKMADLPRSHLSFYARLWEGTSGDRVTGPSDSRWVGKAFAQVAPEWAWKQKFVMPEIDVQGCSALVKVMNDMKVRMGGEKVSDYLQRIAAGRAAEDRCRPRTAERNAPRDEDLTGGDEPSPLVDEVPM